MADVAAIVLAAGESSRMGRQKALLEFAGTTLVDYQLGQLSRVRDVRQIIVVTGHEAAPVVDAVARHARASAVHNAAYRTGKVGSIKAGLSAVDEDADSVLIIAVDQPRPASIVQALVAHHEVAGALITAPARAGRRGHPVIFARALLPDLLAITEEQQGLRAVMQRHAASIHEVEIDDERLHVDLNDRADLDAALRLQW